LFQGGGGHRTDVRAIVDHHGQTKSWGQEGVGNRCQDIGVQLKGQNNRWTLYLEQHPAQREDLLEAKETPLSRTAQNMQLAIVCQRLPGFQLADLHQIEAQLIP
jgi:hypothetical protein